MFDDGIPAGIVHNVFCFFLSCAALVFLDLSGEDARATSYKFQPVAVSYGSGATVKPSSAPSINNLGVTAFFAEPLAIPFSTGVYAADGMSVTPIVSTGVFADATRRVDINNSGEVAFVGALNFSFLTGLYSGTAGHLTPIAEWPGPFGETNFTNPGISDSGTVVFAVGSDVPTSGGGVFSGNGGPLTPIYESIGFGYDLSRTPAVSDNGVVAYVWHPPMFSNTRELRTVIGSSTKTLATFEFPNAGIFGLDVNDHGAVAFTGSFGLFDGGVYLLDERGLRKFADASLNAPYGDLADISLNDLGDVAFLTHSTAGHTGGIYTGPNPLLDRVVEVGDLLDGRTVTSLAFSSSGLNDLGQVAFLARFNDGHTGAFVATPIDVPEPGAWISMATGCILLWVFRTWRQGVPNR